MDSRRWKQVPVGELCEAIYDGPHATPKKIDNGPIFLGISNLAGGRLDLSSTNHLSEEDFVKWTRRVTPKANDIVFSYETRLGEAALLPEGLKCCLGRRMALMRPDLKKVDPQFLLYAYLGPHFQETIRERTVHGSTVDRILLTEFPNYPISIPPLDEQKAIAHILGTLDDKIELNQQMNRTLEAIARALFKSWFIDFDPVRAKLDGRQPAGMDAETAALFPAEFEDGGAIGKIPKGWKVGVADDVINILSGGTPKTSVLEYWNGDIPWFSVKDAPTDSDVYALETEKYITETGVNNSSTQILAEGTTIVSARGTVGRLALVGVPMAMNQSCYGIQGKEGYPDLFIYYFLRSAIVSLQQQTHGTVFETITRQTFTTVKSINPPAAIAQAFDEEVQPFLHRIRSNLLEIRSITSIRDALLPKLLSGEIRVKEAEKIVAEVA